MGAFRQRPDHAARERRDLLHWLRPFDPIFCFYLCTAALQVDGFHQQEVNIVDPVFPDPGTIGGAADQPLPAREPIQCAAYHAVQRRDRPGTPEGRSRLGHVQLSERRELSRGLNLNIRWTVSGQSGVLGTSSRWSPMPRRASTATGGRERNPGAMLPAFNGPRISWKRTTLFVNYTLATVKEHQTAVQHLRRPATCPPNGTGGGGCATQAERAFNNQVIRNVLVSLNVNASTGPAYTLLTAATTTAWRLQRSAGKHRSQYASGERSNHRQPVCAYQFAFGRTAPLPPGIGIFGGGKLRSRTFDQGTPGTPSGVVQAQNLTNQSTILATVAVLAVFRETHHGQRQCRKIERASA